MNTFLTASEMVNIFEEICEAFDAHGEAPKKISTLPTDWI